MLLTTIDTSAAAAGASTGWWRQVVSQDSGSAPVLIGRRVRGLQRFR